MVTLYYVNKTKVGSANEDIFNRCQHPQDLSRDSHDSFSTCCDTNNILSTDNAANHASIIANDTVRSTTDEQQSHRMQTDGRSR